MPRPFGHTTHEGWTCLGSLPFYSRDYLFFFNMKRPMKQTTSRTITFHDVLRFCLDGPYFFVKNHWIYSPYFCRFHCKDAGWNQAMGIPYIWWFRNPAITRWYGEATIIERGLKELPNAGWPWDFWTINMNPQRFLGWNQIQPLFLVLPSGALPGWIYQDLTLSRR